MTDEKPQMYRMHDLPEASKAAVPISLAEADHWNEKGFGIFWTVNAFRGPRRIENLERVVAWAIDIDDGTKADMVKKINGSPLVPSLVIETKRGFQVYWNATDGTPKHWNAVVLERLVPHFGADKNARDLARILRVPGYWHLKNPAEPFMVRKVDQRSCAYSEWHMLTHFQASEPVRQDLNRKAHREAKQEARWEGSDDFWEAVYRLDCQEALARLSGHPAVGGEQYTFRQTSAGKLNIYVDGKGSSCWIDAQGHIGSLSGGGPSIAQWLKWFGGSYADAAKVIKELFPHLAKRR